jgi:choline kinase
MVEVLGKPFIYWQFSIIPQNVEVIVVVGFKGRELADLVKLSKPNATIVINHNYQEMNTAGSFKLGSKFGGERLVSLDGDLLTSRTTLEEFLNSKDDLLGVSLVNSTTPVFSKIVSNQIVNFSYEIESNYEWTGLANLSRESSQNLGTGHMFQGIEKFLPLNFREIDCMEIDEVADIKRMEKWIVENI